MRKVKQICIPTFANWLGENKFSFYVHNAHCIIIIHYEAFY